MQLMVEISAVPNWHAKSEWIAVCQKLSLRCDVLVPADADCREGVNLPLKVIRVDFIGASLPPFCSQMLFEVGGRASAGQMKITGSKSCLLGADGLFLCRTGEGRVLR